MPVAHSYVAASWEVELDQARNRRYVMLALASLRAHLRNHKPGGQPQGYGDRAEVLLLAAELNRRLGQFEDARQILVDLGEDAPASLRDLIAYEIELVDQADSGPHYLPRAQEDRCAQLDLKRPEPPPPPRGTYAPPAPTSTSGPLPPEKVRP